MRPPLRDLVSGSRAGDLLVVLAAVAALASAVWGASFALDRMNEARDYYSNLEPALREEEIELSLGFDSEEWRRIRGSVRAEDRFAVVSDAFEQHEVRNYASYTLLPAIQVADPEDATVVLFWGARPPAGSPCTPLGENACIERRGRA